MKKTIPALMILFLLFLCNLSSYAEGKLDPKDDVYTVSEIDKDSDRFVFRYLDGNPMLESVKAGQLFGEKIKIEGLPGTSFLFGTIVSDAVYSFGYNQSLQPIIAKISTKGDVIWATSLGFSQTMMEFEDYWLTVFDNYTGFTGLLRTGDEDENEYFLFAALFGKTGELLGYQEFDLGISFSRLDSMRFLYASDDFLILEFDAWDSPIRSHLLVLDSDFSTVFCRQFVQDNIKYWIQDAIQYKGRIYLSATGEDQGEKHIRSLFSPLESTYAFLSKNPAALIVCDMAGEVLRIEKTYGDFGAKGRSVSIDAEHIVLEVDLVSDLAEPPPYDSSLYVEIFERVVMNFDLEGNQIK